MDHARRIAGLLRDSRRVVVLTGAGVSTDSGIPDFRSPGEGLWERHDPIEILSMEALIYRPRKFFTLGFQLLTGFQDAQPNPAHEILARFEQAGLIHAIVTQNIDGLHQQAGSTRVLEVHGHLRTCRCVACGKKEPLPEVAGRIQGGELPPRCSCGGIMRPDVVLFGDPMPPVLQDAINECRRADLLLVLGSSLTVAPVCELPLLAQRVAIINREQTPCDPYADELWLTGITDALSQIERVLSPES